MSENLLKHFYKLPNFPQFIFNYPIYLFQSLWRQNIRSKSSEYKIYMDKLENLAKSQGNIYQKDYLYYNYQYSQWINKRDNEQ